MAKIVKNKLHPMQLRVQQRFWVTKLKKKQRNELLGQVKLKKLSNVGCFIDNWMLEYLVDERRNKVIVTNKSVNVAITVVYRQLSAMCWHFFLLHPDVLIQLILHSKVEGCLRWINNFKPTVKSYFKLLFKSQQQQNEFENKNKLSTSQFPRKP